MLPRAYREPDDDEYEDDDDDEEDDSEDEEPLQASMRPAGSAGRVSPYPIAAARS